MQKLTIGRLADETGVHLETIRYYERVGLLRKPSRTSGGHRLYEQPDVRRLQMIHCCRDLGLGLDAIRTLVELAELGTGVCAEVRSLVQSHIEVLDEKIARLSVMRDTLTRMVEACPSDPSPEDGCPVLEEISACRSSDCCVTDPAAC